MILMNKYNEDNYVYKNKPVYDFFKRVFDILLAVILFIIFLPLFLIIFVILKISYKNNIFYLQNRVGKNQKKFKLIKFRTMGKNAEPDEPQWAIPDDPRCTGIGRMLRKTSLDELPQLINILKGDMSFVGPRPERPYFINDHPGLLGKRIKLMPGLTGLAQVNGRYALSIEEKLRFDLEYLHNRCFWLDIKIIIKTIPVILSCKGAW
jgi:lipopolysaccharide/colanic/teichoic acid biosynthesis glycosyltransferase